jgi:transcriptional regulator with XRE-family HTH domain
VWESWGSRVHIAQKFELLLGTYRRPDGRVWSGREIDDATGGVVTRSYITNLRKGRIRNPGYEKLRAIAKAMGFPPKLWFEDSNNLLEVAPAVPSDGRGDIAAKTDRLFESIMDDKTGEPYTNAEVARRSLGDLTEEEVEEIRTGAIANPSVAQVIALADVFGVHPSYFIDRGKKPPIIDREAMEVLRDETVSAIAHKSLRLPGRERRMVLSIIRQLENMSGADDDH